MLDLKKSRYFKSLPDTTQQSIMESSMQSGMNFQSEEELRTFLSSFFTK